MSRPGARISPVGALVTITGGLVFVAALALGAYAFAVPFGRALAPWSPETGGRAVAIDVALFTLFALHHSLFARTGLKQALVKVLPSHYERTTYVWVASVLFIGVLLLWQPVPGLAWGLAPPWAYAGYAAQMAGMWVTLAGARRLDVLDLSGLRQGLALSSRPNGPLVADGLYGFVRHPIYFGWALMVWAAPVMTGTRLAFAIISTAYLAVAVPFEERSLRALFGAEYDAYARRVRWRMLPGLY